ncbi:hypothetical protein EVAR_35391_1 [Eumeta japonica]|uniref:Uncharacterized protein n=1 Tax=Eumeta variegata TaxID=151549 RepID=A0A4C1XCB5_EUMVA|nr:hypothetical protein EVAR_35391_1 [Eumeta japonica]
MSAKTIKSDLYYQQLMRLKQEVEKKRPELINKNGEMRRHAYYGRFGHLPIESSKPFHSRQNLVPRFPVRLSKALAQGYEKRPVWGRQNNAIREQIVAFLAEARRAQADRREQYDAVGK